MKKPAPEPLPTKPPHPADLIKLIRQLADEGRVSFSWHAEEERFDHRGLDYSDVFKVLEIGTIEGSVKPGKRAGEWKCLVVGRVRWSPREVGVATVVVRGTRLIIATVEWMDP